MRLRCCSTAWLPIALLTASCSPSPEEKHAQEAVQKALNRPKPGYGRVLNLSPEPITLYDRGRPVAAEAPTGTASRMVPIGVGLRELEIRGASTLKVGVELTSGEGTTVVLLKDGKTASHPGDPVRAKAGVATLRVLFLDTKGQVMKQGSPVKLANGGASTSVAPGDGAVELAPGTWTFDDERLELAERMSYTLILLKEGNGYRSFFLKNTADEKPVSAGSAAS